MTALIEGIGFRCAARHRSKDVALFSQGEINLILNREREGFAHSFSLLHGPSVCAIAPSQFVESALERATALECHSYVGKIGPGEATLPAVAGVEGSLIYFINSGDPAWRDDFVPVAPLGPEGKLRKVDHLSNVVRRGEFLTWSLFYGAALGLEPQPQVEVAIRTAPSSAACCAARTANCASRSTLERVAQPALRFLDAFGGAGFQQIALSTDDIFAAVEAAKASGVTFLPIRQLLRRSL